MQDFCQKNTMLSFMFEGKHLSSGELNHLSDFDLSDNIDDGGIP